MEVLGVPILRFITYPLYRPREINQEEEVSLHCPGTGFQCRTRTVEGAVWGHNRQIKVSSDPPSEGKGMCHRQSLLTVRYEAGSSDVVGANATQLSDTPLTARLAPREVVATVPSTAPVTYSKAQQMLSYE